jgi:hypothetical protein
MESATNRGSVTVPSTGTTLVRPAFRVPCPSNSSISGWMSTP